MKLPSLVSRFAGIAALSLGLGFTTRVVAVNLVTNGGFETGNFSGWTRTNTLNTEVSSSAFYVHSGTYGAGFGNTSPANLIGQSLTTVVGDAYTLDFWLKSSSRGNFSVSWNGTTIDALSLTNVNVSNYTHYTATGLIATSTSTALQFSFAAFGGVWAIDDINVVSNGPGVSTPDAGSTVALLALGLGALGLARRVLGGLAA